jgi:hypothetical protein
MKNLLSLEIKIIVSIENEVVYEFLARPDEE